MTGGTMTRRDALMFPAVLFGTPMEQNDTSILVSEPHEGGFFVGVKSQLGDKALVEVFYEVRSSMGVLLVHAESIAPVVPGTFGLTWENFRMPKESVKFIRVTLLRTLGEREFGKEPK